MDANATHSAVCGSRGPRIGDEGSPRCAGPLGHATPHRGFRESGFENQRWDDPLWRDREFAADWEAAYGGPEAWDADRGVS
jgi:hypothetical protein